MNNQLTGRRIVLSPLRGESDVERELIGTIEGTVDRKGFQRTWKYYLVKLDDALSYEHPGLEKKWKIDRVLVFPDGTRLEWAFFGGGPAGLPVLTKVFAVIPQPDPAITDYASGETFLLARAVARAP